jgi:hypothetical protein
MNTASSGFVRLVAMRLAGTTFFMIAILLGVS